MNLSRRDLFKAAGLAGIAAWAAPSIAKVFYRENRENPLLLGKLPPIPEKPKLRLVDYVQTSKLPDPPAEFGHESLVTDFGMLGNGVSMDNPTYAPSGAGDCAICGPYHSLMLWCAEAGRELHIDTERVLKTYGQVTYYDPKKYDPFTGDNPTDLGANIQDMNEYWRQYGFEDCDGNTHKIDAWIALEPGDINQLWAAMYLFDGVGIGIECPQQWQKAFQNHQVWDAVPGATQKDIAGGHYVSGVCKRNGNIGVVTWGRVQQMTPAGYEQFCDEAFIYFSKDRFNAKGLDINGFNQDQLMDDMMQLAKDIY